MKSALSQHCEALARSLLLRGGKVIPSVAAVLRSCVETSARALWVLDPSQGSQEAISRALTDQFFEMRGVRGAGQAQAKEVNERILSFAEEAGLTVHRDKRGRVMGIGDRRLTTLDLLKRLTTEDSISLLAAMTPAFQRRANAAVHGNLLSWAEMAASTGDSKLQGAMLQTTVAHLMYGIDLHRRALDVWVGIHLWIPTELFEASRRASLGPLMLYCARILAKDGPTDANQIGSV